MEQKKYNLETFYLAVVLFLVFFIFGFLTYNYTGLWGDMAEYVNNPLRVLNGEIPYRDFWLLFPPGEVYLPALLYKIFGLNVNVVLLIWPVVAALVGAFGFVLGKVLFKSSWLAMLLGVLLFFNGLGHVHFLLLVISTIFFAKYLKESGGLKLFFSGIFIGLAFYFRFFEVAAFGLAIGIALLISFRVERLKITKAIKMLLVFLGGVLLAMLLVYLPLINYWQLIFDSVAVSSVGHGVSMALPYLTDVKSSLGELLKQEGLGEFSFYRLAIFLRTAALYSLPFVVCLLGVFQFFGKKVKSLDKVFIFFLVLWTALEFPKALSRADVSHLAHSVSPAIILLVFLIKNGNLKVWKVFAGFAAFLLVLQMPVKAYEVEQVLAKPHYQLLTTHGRLFFDDSKQVEEVSRAIDFINTHSKEGDPIFVSSWYFPALYALTDRRNPTYYDSLIDVIAEPSPEKQQKICDGLVSKDGKVSAKIIVHTPDFGFDANPEMTFLKAAPLIQQCIEKNFKLTDKFGSYFMYLP